MDLSLTKVNLSFLRKSLHVSHFERKENHEHYRKHKQLRSNTVGAVIVSSCVYNVVAVSSLVHI